VLFPSYCIIVAWFSIGVNINGFVFLCAFRLYDT
jgi:hypothetical protein